MITSKYVRHACCCLIMLTVVGRAHGELKALLCFGGGGVVLGGIGFGGLVRYYTKNHPVKVVYPDRKIYEICSNDSLEVRQEKRILKYLVSNMKDLEVDFIGKINEKFTKITDIKKKLNNGLDCLSPDDSKILIAMSSEVFNNNVDMDAKLKLFLKNYKNMKDQENKLLRIKKN